MVYRIALSLFLGLGCYAMVLAQSWQFSPAIDVTPAYQKQVYHHLESAGRRNIVVSDQVVAITWEDNRRDNPSVYLALKARDDSRFSAEIQVSGAGEAFEPSITMVTPKLLAISWEEDGQVKLRLVDVSHPDKPVLHDVVSLPVKAAGQAGLIADQQRVFVVLSELTRPAQRLRLLVLETNPAGELSLSQNCLVDAEPVKEDQLYPTLALVEQQLLIAWEDRRPGHTIIMAASSDQNQPCRFSQPERISQRPGSRNLPYGKGHGVSRVALAHFGTSQVLAAWADKRNFREGYDIFSAIYRPDRSKKTSATSSTTSSTHSWTANQAVQDEFGGVARQWHATVAGHPSGQLVAAWSDERENRSDIYLSVYQDGEWSEDTPVTVASGPPQQNHPSITLDNQGNIHLAWVERKTVSGVTRLRYTMGKWQSD